MFIRFFIYGEVYSTQRPSWYNVTVEHWMLYSLHDDTVNIVKSHQDQVSSFTDQSVHHFLIIKTYSIWPIVRQTKPADLDQTSSASVCLNWCKIFHLARAVSSGSDISAFHLVYMSVLQFVCCISEFMEVYL